MDMGSGSESLTITLKKIKYYYKTPLGFYADVLMGCHTYKKNGVIVESSMQYINAADLYKHFTIMGKSDFSNSSAVNLSFHDITKIKIVSLRLP